MTEQERELLLCLAKCVRDGTNGDPAHIQRLIIAAQATPVEPEPNPNDSFGNLEFAPNSMPGTHRFGPKSPEPKPSATNNWKSDEGFQSAALNAWHENSWNANEIARLRAAVWAAVNYVEPLICAAKDADTATVIRSNDADMAEIKRLKQQLNDWRNLVDAKQSFIETLKHERDAAQSNYEARTKASVELARERNALKEEVDRLKRSLELYRADIGVLREREEKMTTRLKKDVEDWEIGYECQEQQCIKYARELDAIRHPDIDAAAERSFETYSPSRCWANQSGETKTWWRNIVRAVYGLKSE